ncbi:hypothetical protein L207DRAFT_506989 [Hyaloscypha variabilis F]|uniref:Extracellular membrane protein CFEM domain-containing protein n=1 Tax=Hyaloscypha variabilis (strain UAMH 11265 / GT02V1 / F) TaxID=1149755 RepID=A0A2J6S5H7_HYAVF|nr:hypothetical protein L207DRAFT_506989 [Hyaloscypha variabilis F]
MLDLLGDVCPSHDCLLTTLDMMGRDSQRLLLLATGLIGLAGAETIPSCWNGCITAAVEANPACYDSYGAGIEATSCYCGQEQGGYATDVECCANAVCAATDYAAGRVVARSICSSLGQPDLTDGSFVCGTSTTIFYTGIADAGTITAASPTTAAGSTKAAASVGSSTSALASNVLTASCGSPTFTSVIASATTTSFPLIGCAPNNPSCCPYNINVGGALSACPTGYSTISNTACCPSGWSLYSSPLGNEVPCVTTPVFDLTAPNSTATGTSVVVIVNRIFALQYQLSTATTSAAAASSGLSTGAKAGIGAGVGVTALAVIIGIAVFLIKHHKRTPPTQASASAHPGNMQYPGTSELHSTPASNTVAPVSYVFKPGFMEADSRPLETSPHHNGYVEADNTAQPTRYEL